MHQRFTEMSTLIVDSNYIGHQALYVTGDLSHEEVPTGVIFGFLSRILSLGLLFKTNDIIFCWDSKRSYRKLMYPEYKMNRRTDKTPEQMERLLEGFKQFNLLRMNILPRIGFSNQILQQGYESDDLMAKIVFGTIGEFIIITADEDLYQCLSSNTRIFNPSSKKMMTCQRFRDEYGIEPNEWAKVKAIAGCSTDHVEGVKGVGEKTAIKYMKGKLGEGSKTFKAIMEQTTKERSRNLKLVRLPFPETEQPKIARNQFSALALFNIGKRYGMESFLSEQRVEQWKELFLIDTADPRKKSKGIRSPKRTAE